MSTLSNFLCFLFYWLLSSFAEGFRIVHPRMNIIYSSSIKFIFFILIKQWRTINDVTIRCSIDQTFEDYFFIRVVESFHFDWTRWSNQHRKQWILLYRLSQKNRKVLPSNHHRIHFHLITMGNESKFAWLWCLI